MRKFTLNGNSYTVPEVDFNAVCDLAENGIDIMNRKALKKNPLLLARGIVAWITGLDLEDAGNEIQAHIENGGDLADVLNVFTEAMETSNFTKSRSESAEEKPAKKSK